MFAVISHSDSGACCHANDRAA